MRRLFIYNPTKHKIVVEMLGTLVQFKDIHVHVNSI